MSPTTGYGRKCLRGHVISGDNARRDTDGYYRCRECGRQAQQRQKQRRRGGPVTPPPATAPWLWTEADGGTPWSGLVDCPQCRSATWTLPFDGTVAPGRWRCVWPCHRFFAVSATDFKPRGRSMSTAHWNLAAIENQLDRYEARIFTREEIEGMDEVEADRHAKSEALRLERLMQLQAESSRPVRGRRDGGR